jgi:predicted AAA+ superfamily ATPase
MLYNRNIISKIKKVLPRDEFVILTGARQTGKTSILIILKNYLEKKRSQCHYFNLENTEYLKLLNKHPFNIFELIPKSKTKQIIFIDEIQYLDNPTNFLKLLYDEKRNKIKIIASGSSSFYLDKKFKDSLVGRKFLFEAYPLSFDEFLIFNEKEELLKEIKKNKKLSFYYQKKLNEHWKKYLIFGGYPKVALAKDASVKKIMLEEIGSSYIKKDVVDAGIKNTDKYFSLLKILAGQTGELVNSQELSKTLQMANKTVEEYLYVIKKSYQAAFIKPFYSNIRKELTKMPKVYFYDFGLRNFFLNDYRAIEKRTDKGAYLENIVFKKFLNQTESLDKIKFWRTQDKNEVDFIIGNKAFEVKFNQASFRASKYKKFKQKYPDIKLRLIDYKSLEYLEI